MDECLVKGLYVYSVAKAENHGGVDRKISNQVRALSNAGLNCDLMILSYTNATKDKILRRLPFCSDCRGWDDLAQARGYDYVFIRKPTYLSKELLGAIESFRDNNPKAVVVMEFPTFPYEGELSKLGQKPLLIKDRHNRKKLQRLVDRIAENSGQTDIYSIPTLQIWNGVDLSRIRVKKPVMDLSEVNILCPAKFDRWHGIDRFLEGLANYGTAKRTVKLHLMGVGPALEDLKRQVARLNLQNQVVFYGYCEPEEMDKVYDLCTLGLDSVGIHRRGPLALSSSLKSAEYLAKGLPFIFAGKLDVLNREKTSFCFEVPADDTPIDIESVISFHDGLYSRYSNQCELINEIRKYAERTSGMDVAMKSVVDYLYEVCTDREKGMQWLH